MFRQQLWCFLLHQYCNAPEAQLRLDVKWCYTLEMIVGHFRNFRLQTMPVSIAFAQGMLSAELAALLHNQPQPSKYSKQYWTTQTDPHLRAIVFKFSGRRHCRHKNGNNFPCRSALIIVFECVLIFTFMITPGICRGIFCSYDGLALYHFKRSQRLRRNCVSFEHDSIPQQSKEHKTATWNKKKKTRLVIPKLIVKLFV